MKKAELQIRRCGISKLKMYVTTDGVLAASLSGMLRVCSLAIER